MTNVAMKLAKALGISLEEAEAYVAQGLETPGQVRRHDLPEPPPPKGGEED